MKQVKHQKEVKLCKYTPATLALTIFHPKQHPLASSSFEGNVVV